MKKSCPKTPIPGSATIFLGDCDLDKDGYPITYEVEIWEYPNHLRIEADVKIKHFAHKSDAQEYVQERLSRMLVVKLTVWRIRHCGLDHSPALDRKIIYQYEQD